MEGLAGPCSGVATARGYAKKHDSLMYYDNVARNPRRCGNVVPFDRLAYDLRHATLPTFSFISPNLCNDTHDCDVATGDRFLAGLVPRVLRSSGERMHKVRHSAGQRVLDRTGNLKAVQKLLGHASIQTTGDIDWDIDQL